MGLAWFVLVKKMVFVVTAAPNDEQVMGVF